MRCNIKNSRILSQIIDCYRLFRKLKSFIKYIANYFLEKFNKRDFCDKKTNKIVKYYLFKLK